MPDDCAWEPLLSALEARLTELEAGQCATQMLAGGTDRELSEVQVELRVHRRLLRALQQTQRETFSRVRSVEHSMDAGFTDMRPGFAEMRAGLAALNARTDRLAGEP